MTIEVRDLEVFLALAEELHFGRAAHRLGLTQPAVSRMLRRLEEKLGVTLFERSSRRASLTREGRAFLTGAKSTLSHLDGAIRAARQGSGEGVTALTLGLMVGAAQPEVGELVRSFVDTNPSAQIWLRAVDERDLGKALASGQVDVVIAWDVSLPSGLYTQHFIAVPMSVVLPKAHRLAKKKTVALQELADDPIILPARVRQPVIHAYYRSLAQSIGFEPRISVDVTTTEDLLAMVAGGLGFSMAPFPSGLTYPGVVFRAPDPVFMLNYQLAWSRKTPTVEGLLACLSAVRFTR